MTVVISSVFIGMITPFLFNMIIVVKFIKFIFFYLFPAGVTNNAIGFKNFLCFGFCFYHLLLSPFTFYDVIIQ